MAQVEGFILRSTDYGENDLILTLLTESWGKIGMMARGAKKTASPLRACTTPFTQAVFQVYGHKMFYVQQGSILNTYRNVRSDLTSTSYAVYAVELMDRVSPDKEPVSGLYALLTWVLESMERGLDPQLCARILEARVLDFVGVMPAWLQCAACHLPLSESPYFSPVLGGPLHQACGYAQPDVMETNLNLPKLIYTFQKIPLERIGNLAVSETARAQISKIFQYLLEEFAGIHLRSRRFLDSMNI
ncbi:MAG: repair protein RecO [Bacilli bacterium]|nr:repair protein RecO [Bacilli bacterium]